MMEEHLRDNVARLLAWKREAPSPQFLRRLEGALLRGRRRVPWERWAGGLAASLMVAATLWALFRPAPEAPAVPSDANPLQSDDSKNVWDRPVEVARRYYAPKALFQKGNGLVLAALHTEDRKDAFGFESNALVILQSSDSGKTWKETTRIASDTELISPLSIVMRPEKMEGLFCDRHRKLFFQAVDLASGKVLKPYPIEIEGFTKVSWEGVSKLLRVGDSLYAILIEDRLGLFLLESADGGETWRRVSMEDWTWARHDGTSPLFFSTRDAIHVVFNAGSDFSLVHYVSRDRGKTWEKRAIALGKSKLLTVQAVGEDRGIHLVCATDVDWETPASHSGRRARLVSLTSPDQGDSWAQGGKLLDVRLYDGIGTTSGLAHTAHGWIFTAVDLRLDANGEPLDGGFKPILVMSRDGGKNWANLDFQAGLKRMQLFPVAFVSEDGNSLYTAFVNTASWKEVVEREDTALLFRRWGPPGPEKSPLTEAEVKEIRSLISDFGDPSLDVREEAHARLTRIGERALPIVDEALKDGRDLESRTRLQAVRSAILGLGPWWGGE